jgi:hypothetical protein
LNAVELKAKLTELETLLTDTEEERDMVIGQTGVHLDIGTAERFEEDIAGIKEDIEKVKAEIAGR